MNFRKFRSLASYRLLETHGVPKFRGRDSRTHQRVPIWRLQADGAAAAWRNREHLAELSTLVQFAGFPRSGHSLIGSLIDAHPDARVSHELDIMGLVENHLPMASILALIDQHALAFTHHGRYWNGYCYYVENAAHYSERPPIVIGDKKGDMAVRRIARRPDLLDRLSRAGTLRKKWICVLRNPFDNIATMSLRASPLYDTLRATTHSKEAFQTELAAAQADGRIASRPSSEQIDEYERLAASLERIRQATPDEDWFELVHENLADDPRRELDELIHFLDLSSDADYLDRCAALVHSSASRSRELLDWSDGDRARVEALIEYYPFFAAYRAG